MTKRIYYIVSLFSCIFLHTLMVYADNAMTTAEQEKIRDILDEKFAETGQISPPTTKNGLNKKGRKKLRDKKTISLNADNMDLTDLINMLAAEKKVNIILPMGAQAINIKLTLHDDEKLTIDEAWNRLYTILDVAGYSLIQRKDSYTIVKNSPNIAREALPVYINVAPDKLPNTEKRITYLYYFTHIQVPKAGTEGGTDLDAVLKEILPSTAVFKYDSLTNSIVITDLASNIRAAMEIIKELDKTGFQETLEIIKLRHTQADIVADLFNKSLLASAQQQNRFALGKRTSEAQYFNQNIRIIPEPRTNSLLILGKQQAIERVKEFILAYVDVKLDTGKSILHTYKLQYMDAEPFAVVLTNILQSASAGGTGQSKAAGQPVGGVERFFEDVVITTDKPKPKPGVVNEYSGSNRLIIAARNEDWDRILKLIEELDSPQPQVILEVLIADLTIVDDKILGSIMRNPAAIPLLNINNSNQPVGFQSAQIGQVATNNVPPPSSPNSTVGAGNPPVAVDLDKFNTTGNVAVNIPASLAAGSTVMTLSDPSTGNTWSILQVLRSYGNTKILSHPHVIATNNKKAEVEIGETRLVAAEAVGNAGGTTTARFREDKAYLKLFITPRISSAKTISLQVEVDLNEFTTTNLSNGNKSTRKVETRANILSGDVLALGGLIRVTTTEAYEDTPILGKIPIFGWLFKRRSFDSVKNNLTVFIRPTIIEPRLRGGVNTYTKDYVKLAREYAEEGVLFDSLRDPVTRFFFNSGIDTDGAIDLFLEQHNLERPEGNNVAALATETVNLAANKNFEDTQLVSQAAPRLADNEKTEATKPETTKIAQNELSATASNNAPSDPRALALQKLLAGAENPLVAQKISNNVSASSGEGGKKING